MVVFAACSSDEKKPEDKAESISKFMDGTFGYDLNFLRQYHKDIVVLGDSAGAQVIIAPAYQGRVMTSTTEGSKGISFGWLNHELIASGKPAEHINAFGGEERFWLGPEGGQFSIYVDGVLNSTINTNAALATRRRGQVENVHAGTGETERCCCAHC